MTNDAEQLPLEFGPDPKEVARRQAIIAERLRAMDEAEMYDNDEEHT